jgi:hypothetical protein
MVCGAKLMLTPSLDQTISTPLLRWILCIARMSMLSLKSAPGTTCAKSFFSVVVCLYKERHVRPCLHSILGQTFGDLESIIVKDGSSDRSAEITSAYHDSRIWRIRQANGA